MGWSGVLAHPQPLNSLWQSRPFCPSLVLPLQLLPHVKDPEDAKLLGDAVRELAEDCTRLPGVEALKAEITGGLPPNRVRLWAWWGPGSWACVQGTGVAADDSVGSEVLKALTRGLLPLSGVRGRQSVGVTSGARFAEKRGKSPQGEVDLECYGQCLNMQPCT